MKEETKLSESFQEKVGTEQSLKLYDTPRKLNIETFYEIMETGNLELLIVNQPEKLNELQQLKLNEKLTDIWLDLQEFYYSNTNKQSFNKFKHNFKQVILLQNEITGCNAGLKLVELGFPEKGFEILEYFKISYTDTKNIKSAILRKETKLEFAKNKLDKGDKKESVSFYKIVASVERNLNRQLNLKEINLERWVAYLGEIREKSEAEKKLVQKNKGKKKWQGN